jgi:hypothetical protein
MPCVVAITVFLGIDRPLSDSERHAENGIT